MDLKNKISVIIPCFNVSKFIKPTLDSLTWCHEIIIVDMFSTDNTKEVCLSYPNVKFFERKDFIYANFNYGLEQSTGDWILRLDSDEVVPLELKNELIEIVNNQNPPFDGYYGQQKAYFMGHLIRYGFGNDNWRGMFFKKGKAHYQVRSEHEDLVKIGNWGRLKERYIHYTNPTISQWMNKINYYSDRDIDRWDPKSEKPITIPVILYRTLRWLQRYLTYPHMAIRDGAPGIVVALIAASGLMLQYLKQWEKQQKIYRPKDYFPDHPNAR